ncbi:hypothetical protein GCM10009105_31120 [Dokdonella soli]|uniref:Tetratricopeptide repeat protein n=1 Tax=Dokdonella soli TaxID=529810 RepID=A0ABN1IU52_9GAMM
MAALFIAAPASACGPYFPETLLDDRAATLSQLPEGTFAYEAAHLVPQPKPAFKPVERADWIWTEAPPARDAVERTLLGVDFERTLDIRRRENAAVAYAAGEGLPEDARRYLAGAVAFQAGDMAEAMRRFASVLELPTADRVRYGVWAAYMLGRSQAPGDAAAAAKAFQQVRALVAAGAADPLGMAVDSYGEEARLRLGAGDDAGAIALYAQQAALDSKFGEASLLRVARALAADPARLERGIADPVTQRLITAYLLTRSDELAGESATSDTPAAPASPGVVENFLDAIARRGLDHVEGADRLAALAYRNGRYDLAAQLAAKDSDGLAAWVRAKLALRAGDANAAAAAYAEAAKAFPVETAVPRDEDSREPAAPYCRVEGEAGTLALARGEYVSALEHLYAAAPTYWMDAAFVAERVLTLDELRQFVDKHASVAAKPLAADAGNAVREQQASLLRALLARRLLRSERYDDALAYFDDATLKSKATAYVAARRGAESGDRIRRAEQWYRAAVAAREDGLDLLGYELDPDDQYFGGDFTFGNNFDQTPAATKSAPVLNLPTGPGAGERERVAASVAQPNARFHYRYVAAGFAARAADLVPSRSQAYAATLCQAAGWLLSRDPAAARAYYDRYVKHGPYVEWAADFGNRCEEPDFVGAAKRLHAERIAAANRYARKALPYAFGIGALALVVGVLWRRRRRT